MLSFFICLLKHTISFTLILVSSVSWPLSTFRSVRFGQHPYFSLFGLARTHILVCSVWPMVRLQFSSKSGQSLYSLTNGDHRLFSLANIFLGVSFVWKPPVLGRSPSVQLLSCVVDLILDSTLFRFCKKDHSS